MTLYPDSHTTTDFEPEMLSSDEYNVRGIGHARPYRKDNIFVQRD